MPNILRVLALLVAIVCSAFASAQAQSNTQLLVHNGTTQNGVQACITVQQNNVCGSNTISQFNVTKGGTPVTLTPLSTYQGWFSFDAGDTVQITCSAGPCLGGVNVSFLAPPQCPCTTGCAGFTPYVPGPAVPNGVNQAEVTLNPPSGNQESCDISCNTGANTRIQIVTSGGPYWNLPGGSTTAAFSIANKSVDVANKTDNNCNQLGVLAYGLSQCNQGPSSCTNPSGSFCSTANADTCIIQRTAVGGSFGGTVTVNFLGALTQDCETDKKKKDKSKTTEPKKTENKKKEQT